MTGGATPHRRRRGGFRNRSALQQWTMHFGPNMTPMVDVVMVILIFFMATAAFMGNEWFLKAAIPTEAGKGTAKHQPNAPVDLPPVRLDVVMDVDAAGQTVVSFLELKNTPMEQFLARVAALPRDEQTRKLEIVIKPTARVPYAEVVRAHAACDEAGIYKVGIGVTRTGGEK